MDNRISFPVLSKNISLLPLYITGISLDYTEELITRKDGFNDYQLSLCVSGKGLFCTEGKSFDISEGSLFLFSPKCSHEYFPIEAPWKLHWITFNGCGAENIMSYLGNSDYKVISLKDESKISSCLQEIFNLFTIRKNDNKAELMASSILYDMLISICSAKDMDALQNCSPILKKIKLSVDFMFKNYSLDISLDSLAEVAGLNKYYYVRLFKKHYSVTPIEYLNELRVQKSKEMLIGSSKSISSIASLCGFNDTSYFCRVFKSISGCTPLNFRNRYQS